MQKILLIAVLVLVGALTDNAQERSEALRLGTNTGQVQTPSSGKVDFSGINVIGLAATVTVPVSRTIFLDINGSDVNGIAGDISKPVQTLARAKVLATSLTPTAANPVKIKASPGTFTITTVSLPNYVSLEGNGIDVTIFTSSINSASNGCVLVPGNSSVITDLTVRATAVSPNYALAIGNALGQQAFTNAILNRVKIFGETDGLNINTAGSTMTISNSIIATPWDSVLASGSGTTINIINTQIVSDSSTSSWGTTIAYARGIRVGSGATVTVYGGSVKCSGSATQNTSFNTITGGTLYVYDSTSNASGGALSADLVKEDSGGTLYYSNLDRTDGGPLVVANGTATNLSRNVIRDKNLSDLVDPAAARINLGLSIGSDVQAHDSDLDALAALNGTNTIYYRSAPDTWSPITIGSGISFTLGMLSSTTGGGNVTGTSLTNGNVLQGSGGTNIADGGFAITDIARKSVADTFTGSVDLAGGFKISGAAPAGKIPIGDGTNFVAGDPLVQGLFAEGSTSAENPINIGGYNTAVTPALHGANVQNTTPGGTDYGIVTRPIPSGTQTVSGSVTTTPPANASSNITQLAGTAVSTNSGVKDAGTLRIVIATDQPALSNALSISGTVTSNAGTGTFNNQQSNVTADYDSGAGTQNLTMFGLALPASGGAVAGGTATNPFRIDPTGTTTQPVSGTVTSNAGTNLNTSLLALEGGGNLAIVSSAVRAEDSASADADKGIGMLAIRKATPANTSTTDGDYEYLQLSAGRLWVSAAIDTAIPAGGNTIGAVTQASGPWSQNVTQFGGNALVTVATGVPKFGIADSAGAAFLSAANALNSTGSGIQATQVVGQFDDVSPTSITENQFGNMRMSANRNAYTTLRDAAGNERGANVNASNQLSISLDNVAYGTGVRSATTQRVTISTDDIVPVTPSGTFGVTPAATESFLGFVGGKATIVSQTFTRPADTVAYAIGDLVANSTTAASVVPMSFTISRINDASGMIRRVILKKSGTTTTNANFRLHLYRSDPSASTGIANGDNGAWSTNFSNWIGDVDLDMTSTTNGRAFRDSASAENTPAVGTELNFIPNAGTSTIYGLLEARAAYTPGNAEVFTVYLEDLQN